MELFSFCPKDECMLYSGYDSTIQKKHEGNTGWLSMKILLLWKEDRDVGADFG